MHLSRRSPNMDIRKSGRDLVCQTDFMPNGPNLRFGTLRIKSVCGMLFQIVRKLIVNQIPLRYYNHW